MPKKDPLGRGLSAILKDVDDRGGVNLIPVEQILVNPTQPRVEIKEEPLQELAASIKEKGLLQPILVRRKEGTYEIIAGERRFRAARIAGLREIPAIIKDVDDREALELAMIENLQREDLNPIEVASVYQRFVDEFDYTHEVLAKKVGVERSSVTNYIRLLKLPDWIKALMAQGKLTQGHGRMLITLKDEQEQKRFVKRVLDEGISVRELERARKTEQNHKPSPFSHVEEMLREALKTKVQVTFRKNKGKVIIEFYSKDDLERLMEFIATSAS
jgi:ParB family chromosome partitioning protein